MSQRRHRLTDAQFKRIEPLLPGKPGDRGARAIDNRQFIEGIIYVIEHGISWRGLPECYGNWKRLYMRFNRFSKSGRWARIASELAGEFDLSQLQIDSTTVRAHQHAAGQKKAAAKPKRSAARAAD